MNFETIKANGIVFCVKTYHNGSKSICKYDKFGMNSGGIFDHSGDGFTNGYGAEWKYSDYGKTFFLTPRELVDFLQDEFRKNSQYVSENEDIQKVLESDSLSDELKVKVSRAICGGFYGTMYGGTYKKDSNLVHISNGSFSVSNSCTSFFYVWGWPGPDYNEYHFEDYGKTWALTENEFICGDIENA